MLLRRGGAICAPHTDSSYGATFDTNGNACITMTDEEKMSLTVGMAVCAALLLAVLSAWGGKYLKKELKRRRRVDENMSYKAPLISSSAFSSRPTSGIRTRTPSPEITSPSKAAAAAQQTPSRPVSMAGIASSQPQMQRQVVSSSPNTMVPASPSRMGMANTGRAPPPAPIRTMSPTPMSPTHLFPQRPALTAPPSPSRAPTSSGYFAHPPRMGPTSARSVPVPSSARFHMPILSAQGDLLPPPSPSNRPPRGSSLPVALTAAAADAERWLPSPPLMSPGMPITPSTPTMPYDFASPQQAQESWAKNAYGGHYVETQRYSPVPGFSPSRPQSQRVPSRGASSSSDHRPILDRGASTASEGRPILPRSGGSDESGSSGHR